MSRKLVVLFILGGALLSTVLYSVFVVVVAPAAGPHLLFLTPTPLSLPQQALVITHGQPRLFGPLSDFAGKYGQPLNTDGDQYNFSDAGKVIAVQTEQNRAIQIMVFIPERWSASEKQAYCAQFFPPGAQKTGDQFTSDDGNFSLAILDNIGIIGGQVD